MRKLILAIALLVSGCASSATTPKTEAVPTPTRPLTANEKTLLAASLARTMKDPHATQFKWLPVIVAQKDVPIGYCGLVNGKNSYGGYEGFKRFFATIQKNAKGEYAIGVIEHIEMRPYSFWDDAPMQDVMDSARVTGSCKGWGYLDFTQAM